MKVLVLALDLPFFAKFFAKNLFTFFAFFAKKKGCEKCEKCEKKICHIFGYFGPIFRKFEEFSSGFRIITSKLNNCPYLFDYTMQIFVLCWVYLLHVFSLKYSKMVPFAWHLGGKKWPFLVWPIPKVFIFIYLNKWVPEQFRWQPGRLCQWHELEINVEIAITSGVRMCEKMEGLLMI